MKTNTIQFLTSSVQTYQTIVLFLYIIIGAEHQLIAHCPIPKGPLVL